MTRSRAHALVAALTVTSALLRTLISFRGGLWRDEALFLGVTGLPSWGEMLQFLRYHESHPPLFYGLTRLWMELAGTSDTAALIPPIVLGALLVPAIYAMGTSLFGVRCGLVAATLVTFVPSVNEDGSAVRPYALLTLLVVGSAYLLVVAIDAGGWRRWAAYAFSMIALVYTHNWAWVVVAGMVASAAICAVRQASQRRRILLGVTTALLLAALAFLPWLGAFLEQSSVAGHSGLPVRSVADLPWLAGYAVLAALNSTVLPPFTGGRALLVIPLILAALILLGSSLLRASIPGGTGTGEPVKSSSVGVTVFLVTPIVAISLAAIISPKTNLLVGRCLSSLTPLILLLAAWATVRWIMRPKERGRRLAMTAAISVTVGGIYAAGLQGLLTRPRSNAREIVRSLESHRQPGDLVIIAPGWLVSSVNHYSTGAMKQVAFPDSGGTTLFDFARVWERMQDTSSLSAARRRIAAAADSRGRVWLITDAVSYAPVSIIDRTLASEKMDWAMGKVRTAELRATLIESFGQPALVTRHTGPLPRQEMLIAELFGGSDGGGANAAGENSATR
ncbi:MAG: glycosyltransferase family 39 protein [Gemmatimonadaceae bacterium]